MKQQYWSWLIWKLLIIFAFNIDQEHETENKLKRWSYITSKASKHAAGPFHKRATWRLHHHHHRHNKKALLITFSIHTAIHHTVSMLYWYYILCECHLGFSNFGRFEARYSGRVLDVLKLCNKLRVGQAFKSHRAHKTETQSQWDVDAWPFDWHKSCPACLPARVCKSICWVGGIPFSIVKSERVGRGRIASAVLSLCGRFSSNFNEFLLRYDVLQGCRLRWPFFFVVVGGGILNSKRGNTKPINPVNQLTLDAGSALSAARG